MEPLAQTATLSSSTAAKATQEKDVYSIILESIEDMKADDTVEIDLVGKTSLADRMVITSGRSNRHVGSIADRIMEELKNNGYGFPRVEGMPACDWVLIDAGDVLVHVFRPEVRAFYNLEKMWSADRPDEQLATTQRQ